MTCFTPITYADLIRVTRSPPPALSVEPVQWTMSPENYRRMRQIVVRNWWQNRYRAARVLGDRWKAFEGWKESLRKEVP